MNISQLSKCTVQTALRIEQIRLSYSANNRMKEAIKQSIRELSHELLVRWKKES
jgi:hypothetical protein